MDDSLAIYSSVHPRRRNRPTSTDSTRPAPLFHGPDSAEILVGSLGFAGFWDHGLPDWGMGSPEHFPLALPVANYHAVWLSETPESTTQGHYHAEFASFPLMRARTPSNVVSGASLFGYSVRAMRGQMGQRT
jgi:hypothetical protein